MSQTVPQLPRFVPNTDLPQEYLAFSETPEVLVQKALEEIIADVPPRFGYSSKHNRGLFRGPTALAYLFLKLGATYPSMRIEDRSLDGWSRLYMAAERTGGDSAACGLACESAGFWAVKTMMDEVNAPKFLKELERLANEDEHPYELLFGYAGLLYMIRAVESRRPEIASLFGEVKARIVEKTLAAGPGWTWRGKRYIGAVHGDIGILTQLILTDPKLATNSMVKSTLDRLLSLQMEDGNWNTKDDDDVRYEGLVQFCHGAPGFVPSLLPLRRLFPDIEGRIDEAVKLGRRAIWKQGLLRKEPCICHGNLGNSLAFPPGPQRDHFLAWSLPTKVAEERRRDEKMFEAQDPEQMSTWFNYWPSAAWAWSVCGTDIPSVILYTDV